MIYEVPKGYEYRLHHVRPRFKNDCENVLLFMASEIQLIGEQQTSEFKRKLNSAISRFPGNASKQTKTINNWRTEISALLGLIQYENGRSKPSRLAVKLSDEQNLVEFFRYFCFSFQYPGGHLKPNETMYMIQAGIKFHPVSYLIRLLQFGVKESGRNFGVSKAEITHCVFNDLRVTRDNRPVDETYDLIQENRKKGAEYNSKGDVIRYAGDVMDYMCLANLLSLKANNKYYLKTHELEVLNSFLTKPVFFHAYKAFYNNEFSLEDVSRTQAMWFDFINSEVDSAIFESDISELVGSDIDESDQNEFIRLFLKSIEEKRRAKGTVKTKEIGDVGEAIAIQHEKIRLINNGRDDLAKKVNKIPETYSVGYDIKSFEGEAEKQRLVEVKTTISRNPITINRFHMTPNEWGAAETFRDAYFVYRLMISDQGVRLFVIPNPVGKYKDDKLLMTPRDGVEIQYDSNSGFFEELLTA